MHGGSKPMGGMQVLATLTLAIFLCWLFITCGDGNPSVVVFLVYAASPYSTGVNIIKLVAQCVCMQNSRKTLSTASYLQGAWFQDRGWHGTGDVDTSNIFVMLAVYYMW